MSRRRGRARHCAPAYNPVLVASVVHALLNLTRPSASQVIRARTGACVKRRANRDPIMTVSAPATAVTGTTGTITITTSGLAAGTKYLGSVAYSGSPGMPNPTIIRIDN